MNKKILALDYGTVRVGVAVSRATLAEPLMVLANDENLLKNIKKILIEEEIEQIVIGLSENKMAELTQSFATELKKVTDLPIHFADETLSSHSVHQKLRTAKKSKREGNIDHYAAAEFLQEYLDLHEFAL